MLYEITFLIVCFVSLLCSVCAIYVLYRILGAVQNIEIPKEKKLSIKQKKRIKTADEKATEDRRKMEILLENLERYDGTGYGQKEIK